MVNKSNKYMSASKTILIGRLGDDPKELSGGSAAKIMLATDDKWTDNKGERKEETDWHHVICLGQVAGFVLKYLKKGDLVYVEGKNKTRSYDKEGVKMHITEVRANIVTALSRKNEPQD